MEMTCYKLSPRVVYRTFVTAGARGENVENREYAGRQRDGERHGKARTRRRERENKRERANERKRVEEII